MNRSAVAVNSADQPVIDRGSGITTVPLIGKWNVDDNMVTAGITVISPGAEVPLHHHNVDEFIYVLEGTPTAKLGDEDYELNSGRATWARSGIVHGFRNEHETPARILWVYGGRDVTRTIAATGATVEHLSVNDRA